MRRGQRELTEGDSGKDGGNTSVSDAVLSDGDSGKRGEKGRQRAEETR